MGDVRGFCTSPDLCVYSRTPENSRLCPDLSVDTLAMSIWSGTNTNTTTRSNKCELASNPSKSVRMSNIKE